MASFNYNDYQNSFGKNDQTQNQNNSNRIYYFDLKNNGEEAVVRFMYDSTEEFNIFSVHTLQINGKWRKVNCLNGQYETDKCPLCLAGNKVQNKFFIKLIQYDKDKDGNIVASPKIWERSTAFLKTLSNLINEYGPLSETLFKVKRNGAKGSVDTTYDIMYASPTIYRPEVYTKDTSLFENFDFFKGFILNKTADEMVSILDPQAMPSTNSQPSQYQRSVQQSTQPQQPSTNQLNQFNSTNPPQQNNQQTTSFQTQTQQSPRRTYNF